MVTSSTSIDTDGTVMDSNDSAASFSDITSFQSGRSRLLPPSIDLKKLIKKANENAASKPARITLKDLEEILAKNCGDEQLPIFLHPQEVGKRTYTEDELYHLLSRDFHTRLFITATNFEGKTAFLRSHFTDDHHYHSHLNIIRDIIKATHGNQNYVAARTNLTELLASCVQNVTISQQSASKYYALAVTLASALSQSGRYINFEKHEEMVKDSADEVVARAKLGLLMDIIFRKVATYRFMIENNGSNTFRIAYCRRKHSNEKQHMRLAIFSFLMQLCLTFYVIAEGYSEGLSSWNLHMLPLALLTAVYSIATIFPNLDDDYEGMAKLYENFNDHSSGCMKTLELRLFYFMDQFVNKFLSLLLILAGFIVIMIQDSFIESVLNSAALLFILEIDDQLPSLANFDEGAIVGNYIMTESLKEFDKVCAMSNTEILNKKNPNIGIEFSDNFLTNIAEQPSCPEKAELFQPYQVKKSENGVAQLEPSNFVTKHCLIRSMEWSYTIYPTSKPRIGYLKIEKYDGEEIVIQHKGKDSNIKLHNFRHKLEDGCYIITSFSMSNDILRLRVCGSSKAKDFSDAFEYYNLWNLSEEAKKLLKKQMKNDRKAAKNKLLLDRVSKKETFEDKVKRECLYVRMGDEEKK